MMVAAQRSGVTVAELATCAGVNTVLPETLGNKAVMAIELDSRAVSAGSLFIAAPGVQTDGRNYIAAAIKAGAIAVIAEADGLSIFTKDVSSKALNQHHNSVIAVPQLAQKISAIAAEFYRHPSHDLAVVGVTGTNGKTSCVNLYAQVCARLQQRVAVIGTLGCALFESAVGVGSPSASIKQSHIADTGMTTPNPIAVQKLLAECVAKKADIVAMEVSSHSLDQYRVAAVEVNVAVFTNLTRDHLDYHRSMDEYFTAKKALFALPSVNVAVVNIDDAYGKQLAAELAENFTGTLVCCSQQSDAAASCYARDVQLTRHGVSASITTPWGCGELQAPLLGRFYIDNCLSVIASACAQGELFTDVLDALNQCQPVSGRMQLLAANHCSVVVDYAHTPDALEKALQSLRELHPSELVVVFGCGGDRDKGKRPLMAEIAEYNADSVIVTHDNPRNENSENILKDICAGFTNPAHHSVISNREQAIHFAIQAVAPDGIVLIAGKGHETYQEVGAERLPFSDVAVAQQAIAAQSTMAEQTIIGGEQ